MNQGEHLGVLKRGQYIVGNTDLAAALMAAGCRPVEDGPVSNTYDDRTPREKGKPGHVFFHLHTHSESFREVDGTAMSADALARRGYYAADANELLDDLIEQVPEGLREKIKAQLPLAIMSHHRAAFGNRDQIRSWWRKVTPWLYMKRGQKRFLLPVTDTKAAKRWGFSKK